jgi:hypothetical protein
MWYVIQCCKEDGMSTCNVVCFHAMKAHRGVHACLPSARDGWVIRFTSCRRCPWAKGRKTPVPLNRRLRVPEPVLMLRRREVLPPAGSRTTISRTSSPLCRHYPYRAVPPAEDRMLIFFLHKTHLLTTDPRVISLCSHEWIVVDEVLLMQLF